ncbi:PAC2 family protein [Miltoncostaea marina]|uniref:PAC2 family protein n=1 Tax=Miltoncostaea marina TaxID=2843215 RepID=UPI001C3D9B1D|nr:PAC2 family protein [Miltoncostaea marina]
MADLNWDERPTDLRDPVMVAAFGGWNDAASAASNAIAFIGERFGARRIAAIDPEGFFDFQATRPLVDLTSEGGAGSLVWPEVELLTARPPDGPHDLVLVAGTEPSMRWRTFCALLLDAARELGVRRIITVGALLADVVHTHPIRLTGMASDPALIEDWGFRAPSYAGPTGIVGVLHHAATQAGFESISMWAPVSHYAAGLTNAKGSLALVRALEGLTGITVDAAELEEAASTFEVQVGRAVEAEPRLRALVEQLEDAAGRVEEDHPGPLPTGDELAAELERFLREHGEGGAS